MSRKKKVTAIIIILAIFAIAPIIGIMANRLSNKSVAESNQNQFEKREKERPGNNLGSSSSSEKKDIPVPNPPKQLAWQNVINFSGASGKKSQTFYLGSGQKKMLYNITGDPTYAACSIYIVAEGDSLERSGGIPEIMAATAEGGETVLVQSPGNYYLDINAANCTWEVTIQEMK